MDTEAVQHALQSLDPTTIADPVLREQVCLLSSLTGCLLVEVAELRAELARLRGKHRSRDGRDDPDRDRRGESGTAAGADAAGAGGTGETPTKPEKPAKPERPKDEPRTEPEPPRDPAAGAISLERRLTVDPALLSGPGWRRHGTELKVVHDLLVIPVQWLFHRERWYSAEQQRTVIAALPPGYNDGDFGLHVKAHVLQMGHACRVPQIPLTNYLRQVGMPISESTVSAWLSGPDLLAPFHAEAQEVFRAGMQSATWVGHDVTSTKLNGEFWSCHGLANPWFSSFITLPAQDRAHTLRAFQGGQPLRYRFDAVADQEFAAAGLSQKLRGCLALLPREHTWDAAEFTVLLDTHLAAISDAVRKQICDGAALAAFRHHHAGALPRTTIKDDAAAAAGITAEEAICWWHEARHYEALRLPWEWQQRERQRFLGCYWKLYRQFNQYRCQPTPSRAALLARRFDRLFAWTPQGTALRHRMGLTAAKRERMLTVLRHPAVPLHNNGLERALRSRARKRDVSYQTRSESGLRAWDTMQGLIQTAQKLGIDLHAYLLDRIRGDGEIPRLAAMIQLRAAAAPA